MTRFLISAAAIALAATPAAAVPIGLTKLTGLTGGTPAETAVFRADLSGFTDIAAIQITDSGSTVGGAPGQFSGFDLDAIKISSTFCADAACAAAAAGVGVFDFLGGVIFDAGVQRAPADPKLFGTGPGGNSLDDLVATLALFDADSSTLLPDGFVSLGDGGSIAFNLTSSISGLGLYLYIGEVGDNGETALSAIEVLDAPVPAPGALGLLGLGLLAAGAIRRRA